MEVRGEDVLFPMCCLDCKFAENLACDHDNRQSLVEYFKNNPNSPCPARESSDNE